MGVITALLGFIALILFIIMKEIGAIRNIVTIDSAKHHWFRTELLKILKKK